MLQGNLTTHSRRTATPPLNSSVRGQSYMRLLVTSATSFFLAGCASLFGPADGQFYVTGSTPSDSVCTLSVAVVGSKGASRERTVSGNFRESFVVGPSRQGHTIALSCNGSVVSSRTFKYGRNVHIGGELAVGGSAP